MKDWTENGLTEDGQIACEICNGTKKIKFTFSGKYHQCNACNGSGYMVDYLTTQLDWAYLETRNAKEKFEKLKDWVEKTSKCSICQGKSHKTLGGFTCDECGLDGSCPWGG